MTAGTEEMGTEEMTAGMEEMAAGTEEMAGDGGYHLVIGHHRCWLEVSHPINQWSLSWYQSHPVIMKEIANSISYI